MRESVILFSCYLVAISLMLLQGGCGSGKDDQRESVSSESNVDIVDCSGAVFEGVPLDEVDEIVEAAEEDAKVSIEEDNVFDQPTPTFKVTVVQGCGNTVVNEDNDTTTVVDLSGSEESEAS